MLLAAVAVPVAAFGTQKQVRLDIDGRVRLTTTYASGPRDVLRRAGHEPSKHDMVMPAGIVRPGMVVTLRRARQIQLVLDGRPSDVVVHGLTVGEALSELGVPPGSDDFVSPSAAEAVQSGMSVVLRNAVHVLAKADGRKRDIVSSAPTVGDLVREAGIKVGPKDRIVPAPDSTPVPGMTVRVVRVVDRIEEKRTAVPFAHREVKDAKLEKGLKRVVQRGAEGVRVRRYETTLEDGKPVVRRLIAQRMARSPKDELVRVGTGQPVFKGHGNAQEGLASWFSAEGLSAAHRSLPRGTVVKVTNLASGRSVNVVIRDRGPFVDGRVIDLSQAAFSEISSLGAGTVRVKIEW